MATQQNAYWSGYYKAWDEAYELLYPNDLFTEEELFTFRELLSKGEKMKAIKFFKEKASYQKSKMYQCPFGLKESNLATGIMAERFKNEE